LRPPSFQCTNVTEHALVLHYFSERAELAPMVIGLLEGLATRFATPIQVEMIASRADGADHDMFVIRFQETAISKMVDADARMP
jgi:hypothetical protein